MNKVILMGRLTKDPEINFSAAGIKFAKFSIAVDRRFKQDNEPEADFFSCVSFGKLADFVGNYLHKGTKIVLTGRIQNNNYTNKEGQKVYDVRITAEEIEFAESKGENKTEKESNNGFLSVPEGLVEELPFA